MLLVLIQDDSPGRRGLWGRLIGLEVLETFNFLKGVEVCEAF